MAMDSFLFITKDVEFEETDPEGKFARVKATFLELDKPSVGSKSKTPKIYRFVEGGTIAKSLVGKPIFYGTDWAGRHTQKQGAIGLVESAKKLGKKIKGIVKIFITDKTLALVEALKRGGKFLFSVGGIARFGETLIDKAGKIIQRLYNAVCTHLQMVPAGTKVGFPSAKLEEVIEIQETVMLCEDGNCPILRDLRDQYGDETVEAYADRHVFIPILETVSESIRGLPFFPPELVEELVEERA